MSLARTDLKSLIDFQETAVAEVLNIMKAHHNTGTSVSNQTITLASPVGTTATLQYTNTGIIFTFTKP